MNSKNYDFLCMFYTLSLILMPILGIYCIGYSQITLSDVITFFIAALIIIRYLVDIVRHSKSNFSIVLSKPLLVFFVYIIIRLMLNILLGKYNADHLWCTLRYCWGIVYVFLFAKSFFNLNFAITSYTKISFFVSVYGILQYILLKISGYYLSPGFLSFLGFRIDASQMIYGGDVIGGYLSFDYNKTSFFRVRSCFSEPSLLAEFLIIFLLIQFFIVEKEKNYITIFLSVITLILSSSTTAYGCLIIFAVVWVFKNVGYFKKKNVLKFIYISVPILIIGYFLIAKSDVVNVVYKRVFVTGSAINGRFGNYGVVNSMFENGMEAFWGLGEITNPGKDYGIFLPSIPRMILFYGYSGIIIFLIAVIFLIKRSPKSVNVFALYLFVKSFFSMSFFHFEVLFTFALIISLCKTENSNHSDNADEERIIGSQPKKGF